LSGLTGVGHVQGDGVASVKTLDDLHEIGFAVE
jgi:hypothetical protein